MLSTVRGRTGTRVRIRQPEGPHRCHSGVRDGVIQSEGPSCTMTSDDASGGSGSSKIAAAAAVRKGWWDESKRRCLRSDHVLEGRKVGLTVHTERTQWLWSVTLSQQRLY